MIEFVVEKWEKNKKKLEEYFSTHDQEEFAESYSSLLKRVIELILNDGDYSYSEGKQNKDFIVNDITVIDYGDYQGTQIFVFPYNTYQPSVSETFYTSVYYGSCSGCDTLMAIASGGKPNKNQVKDFMTLSLNLIQNIKSFKEEY